MLHLRKKEIFLYPAVMVFLLVLLPWICIHLFPAVLQEQQTEYHGTMPETVRIYLTQADVYETMSFEKYIQGVVAAEMPAAFEEEALKAQAVASRTYALGRINAGSQLCDSVHCQAYRENDIDEKIKDAVTATQGQVLLYKGELAAHALYFSSSAGKTENAQDVFSGTYPYLVSVDSDDEPGATHKEETLTMSIKAFGKTIKAAMADLDFGTIKKSNIKVKSRSQGGRAAEIQVGKQIISGTALRSALSLYSTRISFSFSGDDITITTAGSGHGVGMSQYGANGMAKQGKTYTQILAHYYQNTLVSNRT
jgi:stage II sporulation protein D